MMKSSEMVISKRILIVYDFFTPAFRAGGPIRSIYNLVKYLGKDCQFYILATNMDRDGSILKVQSDLWHLFDSNTKVFYASSKNRGFKVRKIIKELNPDILYINGIYSLFSTIAPLQYARDINLRVVISPRGMLQKKAMAIKSVKKKIYLFLLKFFLLRNKKIFWHFTGSSELAEFKINFTNPEDTFVIGNIPASYLLDKKMESKSANSVISMLTVALVSPMKNHLKVLKELKRITEHKIVYDIYGPIKDNNYWQECLKVISGLPSNVIVNYKGEINPDELPQLYPKYHYYIQPSQSENFGHSIFEALACGLPVIISDQTPWKDLKMKKAGWDIDLSNESNLSKAVNEAVTMDNDTYQSYRQGARTLARSYIDNNDFKKQYFKLFGIETNE